MAQLYFRYGAMNSSKTANLLMVAHNYESQNRKVLLFKPLLDIRSNQGKIESRIGISHSCVDIDENFKIFNYIHSIAYKSKINCILIDEAQFLSEKQVKEFVKIVDKLNIPVIAYGLKNSYVDGKLFRGSEALLYYADKIEEIKTVCTYCNKKAIMNLRILNNKPIYNGNTVNCGDINKGKDYYIPVCRKHYYNPKIKNDKQV